MKLDIVHHAIENYLLNLHPVEDKVLQDMEEFAAAQHFPIVGPLVGGLLYQLALILKPNRIFEMGSGFGYSAYWFARAMGMSGEIICTDGSNANAKRALESFRRAGIQTKVRFEIGNAVALIDSIEGNFDIIFIDIDKELYPSAFRKGLPRLNTGGLLIADNVLWGGAVITDDPSPSTQGIKEYTRLIYETKKLFTTIIPVRDGVSISVKLP